MEGGTLCSFAFLDHQDNADEIASVVEYLASPEASYLTGAGRLPERGFGA